METGHSEDDIWNAPKNEPLRQSGRSRDVLHPGDILYVPDTPPDPSALTLTAENGYAAAIPVIRVEIAFAADDEPRASQKYRVELPGRTIEKTTGADGVVAFDAPVTLRFATIEFIDPPASYRVHLGGLDPVRERSGQLQRLRQLGYLPETPPAEEVTGEALRAATSRFQRQQGLTPSGDMDDETAARLERAFGC